MLAKSTEYAIRALVFIQLQNWQDKRTGVVEIAKEIEAPEAFTAKVLQTLTKHRIIDSMKGRGGGFFFTETSDQMTLFQVIQVMEGESIFHKCGFGLKNCSDANPCPMHDKYRAIRDGFFAIAQSETIHSLSLKVSEGKAVLNRVSFLN
ncbi:MAG: Rrf2 family transcriptional regulator [Salinivirgaceae bacterium]|nr:Rrf2 family transcriptional regulator [Salinivirgaceae bacterium]